MVLLNFRGVGFFIQSAVLRRSANLCLRHHHHHHLHHQQRQHLHHHRHLHHIHYFQQGMISNPVGGVKEAGEAALESGGCWWRAYILIYTTGKPKPIQEVEQVQVGEVVEELKEEEEVEGVWEVLADILQQTPEMGRVHGASTNWQKKIPPIQSQIMNQDGQIQIDGERFMKQIHLSAR